MTLDQRSTDWQIQDSNTTDWRGDVRRPSDTIPASLETTTDWVEDIRGDAGDNVAVHDVTTVFGRTGDVVAELGDYESGLVSIEPPLSPERPYGTVRLYLSNLSTDVDTAVQASQDASNAASAAAADAAEALSTAEAVDGKAQTALDTAEAASTTAEAAQTTATAAESAAASADSKAVAAQTTADAAMPKAGGVFTGLVTLSGPPTVALHSATKAYVDGFVPAWTVITGKPTTIAGYGITDAYTKAQVDSTDALAMPKAGGTFTGAVTFGTTDAATLPVGTTVQRPAGTAGQIRYNSQLGTFEGYTTIWGPIGGGGISVGTTPPSNPTQGTQWFDSEDGNTYLWYDDGNSQQWVPGTAGTALALDQSALLSAQDNLIQNGGFDIWQRGTSGFSSVGATPVKTADRWYIYADTGATVAVAQFVQAPNDADRRFSYNMNRTVAGSGTTLLNQKIENVRTAGGQTVTIAFEINTSVASAGLFIQFQQFFGTGGSPSASVYTSSTTFSTAVSTWERKVLTVALPSIVGKTIGTNGDDCLIVALCLPSAVGVVSCSVSNVDVRLGTLAPSKFLRRSIDQELAMCQRYYQKINELSMSGVSLAAGNVFNAEFVLPVVMRTTPTVAFGTISYSNASTFVVGRILPEKLRMSVTTTGGSGVGAFAWANVTLDAEL